MSESLYSLRALRGAQDFRLLEDLNRAVWGEQSLPDDRDLLVGLQDHGALVAAAFSGANEIAAYLTAFPTRDPSVQYSHKLGVHPAHRGQGLGAKLKWFQREWALARGIQTIRWSYDPLRATNAHLNIHKLGAVANVYKEDYYGAMSDINAGAASDRVIVQWQLESLRLDYRASHPVTDKQASFVQAANTVIDDEPVCIVLQLEAPISIQIPKDFPSILRSNPRLAQRWRDHSRKLFKHYFARGFYLTGFSRVRSSYFLQQL